MTAPMGTGDHKAPGALMAAEVASQPVMWQRAAELAAESKGALPARGARTAVVGCGTSWFIAQSYAVLRENALLVPTDAYAASESRLERDYDAVIAITRSGTTTEVLDLLEDVRGRIPSTAIVGDSETPVRSIADHIIALPFADERSVVQTRFATSVLAFLRASLGEDLTRAVADASYALTAELDPVLLAAKQFSFLGRGWTVGLANEAALKMREASQSWTESYPAMEYRHGPISIAEAGTVTWGFGDDTVDLKHAVVATGAHFEHQSIDPMADLIRVQRVALERAIARGLDPDAPRNLSRSVVLA